MDDETLVISGRLVLGPVVSDDLAEYHRLHSDPTLFEFESRQQHPDVAHSRAALEDIVDGWTRNGLDHWALRLDDGRFVGVAGARRAHGTSVWSLYYRIHREFWGHGFVHDALRAAVRRIPADDEVIATMHPANVRSAAVASRLGLAYGYTGAGLDGDELVFSATAGELT